MAKPKLDEFVVLGQLRGVDWDPPLSEVVRYDLVAGPNTFESKSTKVQWQLDLAARMVAPLGGVVEPAKGNSTVLFAPSEGIARITSVLVALLRDLGPLADQEYLKFFYECKDAGDVEAARGYRAKWLTQTLDLIRAEYLPPSKAPLPEAMALLEAFRDSKAQTRLRRPEPVVKPHVPSPAVLEAAKEVEKARAQGAVSDERLQVIYRAALEAGGARAIAQAEGVCFDVRIKGFSINAAVARAALRLGVKADRFAFFNGYLYLSSSEPIPDPHHIENFEEAMKSLGKELSPSELETLSRVEATRPSRAEEIAIAGLQAKREEVMATPAIGEVTPFDAVLR